MKVYLDTSVISFLLAKDSPEKMADTRALWEMFKTGEHEAFLSRVTLDELNNCHEPKRSQMIGLLSQIKHVQIPATDEITMLAQKIVDEGILKAKNIDDCRHLAFAILGGCDCIASWNFRHIVNIKTICGVRKIAKIEGCGEIEILAPSSLIEKEFKEDW